MDTRVIEQGLGFAGFVLNPNGGELCRGHQRISLRPKSFDVLWYLAQHAGRVISKEELFAAIWPGVIVGDDSLVHCIADIREALADADRRLVRTVAKRGYQLDAKVRAIEIDLQQHLPAAVSAPPVGASTAAASAATARPAVRRLAWPAAAVAGLLVLVAGGLAAYWTLQQPGATAPGSLISIVVLPLANLSGDADQDYLAEALTNDVTTDLTRMRGAFVIARNTANRYKDRNADAAAVARELGVRYFLKGSVRRLDDVVRLNLDLVEASTGRQLWAERLDADRRHIAAMQVRVTDSLARTLQVELMDAEAARGQRERPSNPDAYDLAMRAWVLWNRQRPETVAEARELALRAIALDPNLAIAWSVLSSTYTADVLNRWMNLRGATREEWLGKIDEASARANALDPENYFLASCTALMFRDRLEESIACRERAITRFPNDPLTYHMAAQARIYVGDPRPALDLEREAMRVSPRDSRMHNFHAVMSLAHMQLGEYAAALAQAERSVQLNPQHVPSYSLIAAAAAQLGDLDKAHTALAEFRRGLPAYGTITSIRRDEHSSRAAYLAQREHFYAGLRRAGLPD